MLQLTVSRFLSLYDYGFRHGARTRPLMIVGERGTEKSLFSDLFETRWKSDHPGQIVTHLNAAAFPDTLCDSELFGHKKGASTGATENTIGLLAKGGLIILHEIGEMSHAVQAKLLTFLEDGKYRRLGENEIKNAPKDIQIISTTNKPKQAFRPDFYDRFFIFRIPPMHQRRVDAIYYLAWKFPEVVSELRPWEVLALLSHPWPGGVREIERVGEEVGWFNLLNKDDALEKDQSVLRGKIGYEHTKISEHQCLDLYRELQRAKVDIKTLENLLNRYGLGVDCLFR
jgi:transcriptional regulator with PAS, ATPase and Fis domain